MLKQLVPQDQRCIGKVFLLQYTGLRLPAFQNTQDDPR